MTLTLILVHPYRSFPKIGQIIALELPRLSQIASSQYQMQHDQAYHFPESTLNTILGSQILSFIEVQSFVLLVLNA